MEEVVEIAVYKKPYGYIYITDVTERYEEELLDEYRVSRRFGETLLEIIPLYREVM